MATRGKPLLDSDWPAITRLKTPTPNNSLGRCAIFRHDQFKMNLAILDIDGTLTETNAVDEICVLRAFFYW